MKTFVTDELEALIKLYKERNATYGESYKQHGVVMKALFKNGIELKTADDFARFGIVNMLAGKLNRYTNNFKSRGHEDSIRDIAVYAMLALDLDRNGIDEDFV